MTPSVSEADWELTEGAVFHAREADAGLAFIQEYERVLAVRAPVAADV